MTSKVEPDDRYFVGGAGLPVTESRHGFPFDRARRFQGQAVDWIHGGGSYPPVSAVAAPTGGGKTAIIAALADASELGTLCTYPTNALIDAQTETLRTISGYDLSVTRITGETLSGTGETRSMDLLNTARQEHDVVVTNPDVLQAIVQGAYFSPGGRILSAFSLFDAAVFDEFHYYDPLAASGLLTQFRILSQRGRYKDRQGVDRLPRVLLTSATPDETFLTAVSEGFGINTQTIRSELVPLDIAEPDPKRVPAPDSDLLYERGAVPDDLRDPRAVSAEDELTPDALVGSVPADVSRFRYPMEVARWPTRIGDDFETVAGLLDDARTDWTAGADPVAAVVFNSAARSNNFQRYIAERWPDLADVTRKDNGYDTNAVETETQPGSYAVLNTTSKGEVGLDFDLRRLVVAVPMTATSLIQRVGRAARQSPATVDLFGMGDPTWPTAQSYPGFLGRVLDWADTPATPRERLRELAGMRAGRAIGQRYDAETYYPDVEEDFRAIPGHDRWRAFFSILSEASAALTASFEGPTLDADGRRALIGARSAIRGLDALRGRSVQATLTLPVGDGRQRTEYDLARALRHSPIKAVETDGTLRLGEQTPSGPLTALYPGEPLGGLDVRQSGRAIEAQLTDAYTRAAETADFRATDVNGDVLAWLFRVLPLRRALLPTELRTSRYRIIVDTDTGEVSEIYDRRSE